MTELLYNYISSTFILQKNLLCILLIVATLHPRGRHVAPSPDVVETRLGRRFRTGLYSAAATKVQTQQSNCQGHRFRHGTATEEFERKEGFQVYASRWLILIIFMFVSFNQTLCWLTFSPISIYSREYFDLCDTSLNASYDASCSRVNGKGQDDIDLMLAWGGIIYLLSVPVFIFLTFDKGLKLLLTFTATMLVVGCTLRIVPRTFLLSSIAGEKYDLYIVHAAQIMFALTGPSSISNTPAPLGDMVCPVRKADVNRAGIVQCVFGHGCRLCNVNTDCS